MDEPLKSLITGIGYLLAAVLLTISAYITGKVNSRKDATKLAIETESQRNRSEETFRSSFAEQKVKSDKLERQMRYLFKKNNEQAETIKNLTIQVTDLTALVSNYKTQVEDLEVKMAIVVKERDDALEQLKVRGI